LNPELHSAPATRYLNRRTLSGELRASARRAFDDVAHLAKARRPAQFLADLAAGGHQYRRVTSAAWSNLARDRVAG